MGAHRVPMDMVGQDIWVFMQLPPYMPQTGILILFAAVLLGVSRILTR